MKASLGVPSTIELADADRGGVAARSDSLFKTPPGVFVPFGVMETVCENAGLGDALRDAAKATGVAAARRCGFDGAEARATAWLGVLGTHFYSGSQRRRRDVSSVISIYYYTKVKSKDDVSFRRRNAPASPSTTTNPPKNAYPPDPPPSAARG